MLMCVQHQDLSRIQKEAEYISFHRKDVRNSNVQFTVNPYTGSLGTFPLIVETSVFTGTIDPW